MYDNNIVMTTDPSWLQSILSKIRQFNCCLLPHYQSQKLLTCLQKYKEISLYADPYYGQCYLIQDKTESKILFLALGQQKTFLERNSKYKALQSLSSKHIITTQMIDDVAHRGFMWSKHDIYLLHDYILVDLEKEFNHRAITQHTFSDSEVKRIASAVVEGLLGLQEHSSLRMKHIYFCNHGEQIKIAPMTLFSYQHNMESVSNARAEGIYLSPEQMVDLERKEREPVGQQSNAYTVGMIMLSLLTMNRLTEVYNYDTYTINDRAVAHLLQEVNSKHSYEMYKTVQALLVRNYQQRLSLRALHKRLSHTQTDNVHLMLLKDDAAPEKMPQIVLAKPLPVNYLEAIVYPKVTMTSEYMHLAQEEQEDNEGIVARQRIRYMEKEKEMGYYVGGEPKGIFKYRDGQTYEGEWSNQQMHGQGKLYFKDGRMRYEGELSEGMFHGQGVEYGENSDRKREEEIQSRFVRLSCGSWIKYQGMFKKDVKSGAGKVYFKNGIWSGNFKNGQPNGDGIYMTADNGIVKGVWEDGILIKKY